ncbi:MAG: hypothetical protein GX879_04360 [Bacteroidales bacterium]|nr:hypothetical protein [Bacteroidales bacterium]
MLIETPAQHEYYLRKMVINPPKDLLEQGFTYQAVLLLAQSFEVYGAYFDNKPFRASAQSLKRFRLAIENLFGYNYHKANIGNQLYKQLRSSYIHTLLPSERLLILDDGLAKDHLKLNNGVITIIPTILHKDVKTAGNILIQKLHDSTIKPKRISSSIS